MGRSKLVTFVALLILGAPGWVMTPHASIARPVPSPLDSDVPDCLVACPEGEILYRIVVRDFARNLIAGSSVVLDFDACPVFPYCGPLSGPYQIDPTNRTIEGFTGVDGVIDFRLALRGTCGDITVAVYADGVQLDNVRLPVMDQNGDGVVGAADAALATAKIGGGDRSADVNCSGSVSQSDVDIILTHNGHECPLPTSARRSSWGTLKIHYR